jgi:hypothetical protein
MASEHKCDLIDLEMYLLVESPKAFKASFCREQMDPVWLSKSLVQKGPTKDDGSYVFTMPRWIADEKGLI